MLVGGPRVLALVGYDPSAGMPAPPWSLELWYALSAATVRMPRLDERDGQRMAIAQALMPVLAARMGVARLSLDRSAMKAIEQAAWPGNLRQMRAVLSAVLATHRDAQPVSRLEIEAQLATLSRRHVRGRRRYGRQIAAAAQTTARRGGLLPFGIGAVGLSGGCGSGARKLVCSGAPPRAHPASARLPPWHSQRSCIAHAMIRWQLEHRAVLADQVDEAADEAVQRAAAVGAERAQQRRVGLADDAGEIGRHDVGGNERRPHAARRDASPPS